MKAAFGIFALVINLLGYAPYVYDILRHKVKPQRVTWGIWSVLTSIVFVNQVLNGGGWSAWFFGSTTIVVTLTFALSLKYGVGGASKLDRVSLGLAALLFAYWLLARDTRLTTNVAVLIDIIGAIPTLLKAYRRPHTESYPQWVMAAAAGFLSLLAIESTDYILFVYPLYIIFMNTLIVSAKFYAERQEKAAA